MVAVVFTLSTIQIMPIFAAKKAYFAKCSSLFFLLMWQFTGEWLQ
jgi:hypothetical protein